MSDSNLKAAVEETAEHRQMRRIAFVAVVVSTVAVIAAVVTLPMLYSYVQSFQSHLLVETDYCKVSELAINGKQTFKFL